jgi:rubrerythrin
MRSFKSLKEREVLALAISLEEEDARVYADLADGLKDSHPDKAAQYIRLRAEEDGHRHRLLSLYRDKFGEHIPLIRRQDVKGFVARKPFWLVRPLELETARKQAETMEAETRRFYEAAAGQATGRRCSPRPSPRTRAGTRSASAWPPAWGRASAWASPRRFPTTAA